MSALSQLRKFQHTRQVTDTTNIENKMLQSVVNTPDNHAIVVAVSKSDYTNYTAYKLCLKLKELTNRTFTINEVKNGWVIESLLK